MPPVVEILDDGQDFQSAQLPGTLWPLAYDNRARNTVRLLQRLGLFSQLKWKYRGSFFMADWRAASPTETPEGLEFATEWIAIVEAQAACIVHIGKDQTPYFS